MYSLQHRAEAIAAAYVPPHTGRPSEIADADLLKQLFAAIEAGNYLETACELVGLSNVSVYAWRKRGEAGERPFDMFARALKEASAKAEAQAVANVRQAGKLPQFWAAEMTYLERRHPDRWGRRQESDSGPKVVVNIGVGASEVRVSVVSPPTFAPDSPLEDSANLLTGKAFALPSSHITAIMVPKAEPCQVLDALPANTESLAVESERGPYPVGGGAQGERKAVSGKGRSAGLARKKKGGV